MALLRICPRNLCVLGKIADFSWVQCSRNFVAEQVTARAAGGSVESASRAKGVEDLSVTWGG